MLLHLHKPGPPLDRFLELVTFFSGYDPGHRDDKPFFVWLNATRMHAWTRLSKEWEGKTGHGLYADGMAQHDHDIGPVLDKLDEWDIANNTIVVYSTDNGAEKFTWPDGGTIPFRPAQSGGGLAQCREGSPATPDPGTTPVTRTRAVRSPDRPQVHKA
jgi:arylsulfatase A-like enzyme